MQKKVLKDPGKGIRPLARLMNIGVATMRQALNDDHRHSSCKRRQGQFLTAKTQNNGPKKGKQLLNKVEHSVEPGMFWFFSDEQNFCQNHLRNTKNNGWLAFSSREVPCVVKTKFPQTVMIFE